MRPCFLGASAMGLAESHRLSVYDALYLAVAAHTGAALITADHALRRLAAADGSCR